MVSDSTRHLKIFLASTFVELKRARDLLTDTLAGEADTILVRLEQWELGSSKAVKERVRDKARECDIAILLLGFRYGSCPDGDSKSYTEYEYDAIREAGKPYVAFLVDEAADDAELPRFEEIEPAQAAFRARVVADSNGSDCKVVHRSHELVREVLRAAHAASVRRQRSSTQILEQARDHIRIQLSESHEFDTKYMPAVFIGRKAHVGGKAPLVADYFWGQFVPAGRPHESQNCFVIVGRTGAGKTNVVCDLADSAFTKNDVVPVLLSANRIRAHRGALYDELLRALQPHDQDSRTPENALTDLVDLLREVAVSLPEHQIVLFLDAINELPAMADRGSYSIFNQDLRELLVRIRDTQVRGQALSSRVRLCITCRTEYWKDFSQATASWMDHIFGPSPGTPTVELEQFSDTELQGAKQSYFSHYNLHGLRVGGAVDAIIRDPVMLRYFCEAYGSIESEDKVRLPGGRKAIESLSRMAIFEAMVNRYRELLVADLERSDLRVDDTEVFELTTGFLVSIAHYVYQRGGERSFTAAEALQVARDMGHPNASMSLQDFCNSPGSVFRALVGHRLLIEKDQSEGLDNEKFWFVFDSYFEFCLGRYFALVEWTREGTTDAMVLERFEDLVDGNARGLEGHSPLTGALPYAVLVVSRDEAFAGRRHLFLEMIALMLRKSYLWSQQAMHVLRDSDLATLAAWNVEDQTGRDLLAPQLRKVMGMLSDMVGGAGWDHVRVYDVSETLRALASAHDRAAMEVFAGLRAWTAHDPDLDSQSLRMRRVYATTSLVALRRTSPERFATSFEILSRDPALASDFWVVRALVASVGERTDDLRFVSASVRRQQFDAVLHMAEQSRDDSEGFSPASAIRGECVASLITLSDNDEACVRALRAFMEQERSTWVWWRITRALRSWDPAWGTDFPRWVEERVWHGPPLVLDGLRRMLASLRLPARRPVSCPWRDRPVNGPLPEGEHAGVIVFHPEFLEPEYAKHLECRERLASMYQALLDEPGLVWAQPLPDVNLDLVTEEVHNGRTDRHRGGEAWTDYLARLEEWEDAGERGEIEGRMSGPLEMRPGILRVAKISAGAVEAGVRYTLHNPGARAAWALNRPPGHLANNVICVLNNAAYGAAVYLHETEALRAAGDLPDAPGRVVVLDLDVHHGKHTQQVFIDRSDVVFVSLHFEGAYSNEEGTTAVVGNDDGEGFTFNLPFTRNCRDEAFVLAVYHLVAPVLLGLDPEMLILCAGFDGLRSDPITPQGQLTPAAYGAAGRVLRAALDQVLVRTERWVKVVGTVEGGYSLTDMGQSYLGLIRELGAPTRRTAPIRIEGQPHPGDIDFVIEGARRRLDACPNSSALESVRERAAALLPSARAFEMLQLVVERT